MSLLLKLEKINDVETRKSIDVFVHLLKTGFPEEHILSELIKHIDELHVLLIKKENSLIRKVYNELRHFKDHGSIYQTS